MKARYIHPLKYKGFHPFTIPPETTELFEKTLQDFAVTKKFRFPPQEGASFESWPSLYKESYIKMEAIARECYFDLASELCAYRDDKDRKLDIHKCLEDKNIKFDTSFMNIFNYQYGFLKPHKDRCLVTIIYRQYCDGEKGKQIITEIDLLKPTTKSLWSHDIHFNPSGKKCKWINVDNTLCSQKNQVCMFIGEEMATLSNQFLSANEHCVTENPNLPYNAHDGGTSNRMSLALVLSSPTISSYIECNLLSS